MKRIIIILGFILMLPLINAQDYNYKLDLTGEGVYNCLINTDNKTQLEEFNSNVIKTIIFQNPITDFINIKCNESQNAISLLIYTNNDLIYRYDYNNIDTLNFNLSKHYFNYKISNLNNTTICTLTQDGVTTNINNFDTKETYINSFNINCNQNSNFEILIQDKHILYYDVAYNTTTFNYNKDTSISKPYLGYINVIDKFNSSISCYLYLDNVLTNTFNFNNNQKFSDRVFNFTINNNIMFNCNNNVSEVHLLIYNRLMDKLYYSTIYNNVNNIDLNVSDVKKTTKPNINVSQVPINNVPVKIQPIIKQEPPKEEIKPLINNTIKEVQAINQTKNETYINTTKINNNIWNQVKTWFNNLFNNK